MSVARCCFLQTNYLNDDHNLVFVLLLNLVSQLLSTVRAQVRDNTDGRSLLQEVQKEKLDEHGCLLKCMQFQAATMRTALAYTARVMLRLSSSALSERTHKRGF